MPAGIERLTTGSRQFRPKITRRSPAIELAAISWIVAAINVIAAAGVINTLWLHDRASMAVAGPHEGGTFPLPDGEFTIGRDAGNGLSVAADDRLSGRHAAIVERLRQFTIRDLTERGRTYVNQLPVAEQVLAHDDEIRIGRSVFLFLIDGQSLPAMAPGRSR